ncbi:hypothetical protein [Calothrix sp. PCC 7507]|uniref:hypothetical protein n=1 Tax=Calothrix sp. PCC 7507 TaxID=99598 RepID=UPI00029EDD8D|nr:hypothetical protein [Calothrix sp. PCC 7507]AFY33317.1 hypothetical protein Cal7507_2903 [Calothrix sp. PCC 7507]
MSSIFTKKLSILAIILTLIFFIPGIALAAPTHTIILAQASTASSDIDLTPLQRQELQAVRQRRNREILAILDSSQRAQLAHNLRHGDDLTQALRTLNLRPEQADFVKAIVQLTNLKLRAIAMRHALPVARK